MPRFLLGTCRSLSLLACMTERRFRRWVTLKRLKMKIRLGRKNLLKLSLAL